jgi:transmembrane sensor
LRTVIAIAACVTLALAGWALQRTREARAAFSHTYTTASGDYLRIGLPDKSVLQVNADTTVHVQFNTRERRVLLQRGEAHFAVAKNPARPFVVGAGQVSVRAVGTGFNVRIDSATVEVLVTEGRVQVEKTATAPAAAGVKDSTERAAPVLVAGQRVTIPRIEPAGAVNSLQVSSLDSDAVKSALEWQAPRLAFRETPLSEVVRQFNQHNRVQLVIGDTALGDRPVGGTFRADMVETFVGLLEKSRDVAVERPSPDRIILRRVTPAP